MRIKRLKLSGFKSFVEPAELRIEPGLTGVVGPNGCGKSNLLEAIRWVMGENSPKSMRGGGMEDVIFAGTANRPPRAFAEVILLAETEKREELEVVRRIERGAGSAYRINGSDSRAKDVALIFADAATGAHSPALVSQGRIASVISAKPAERRLMLEEAAGIAGLHVRRKDAEQKLRATETNLARLEDIMAGLDKQIGALRRQARAAERYTALSERIQTAEARLLFARWRDAAKAADAARKEAQSAEQSVTEAQDAAKHAQSAQAEAARQLAQARDEMADRRDDASAHGHRMTTLTSQLDAAEERLAALDRQRERLEQDHGDADRMTKDAATALARLEKELAEGKVRLGRDEDQRPALTDALDNAARAARQAELDLAQSTASQAGVEAEWRIAEAELESVRARLARLDQEETRQKAMLAQLTEQADPETAIAAAQSRRELAQVTLATSRASLAEQQARKAQLQVTRDEASENLASAKAELAGIEREHGALQRDREARAKSAARSHGLPAAIDTVRAAPGYERALAAALGRDAKAVLGKAPDDQDGRFWTGAAASSPVPGSLAGHVSNCPEELAARLALVHVAEQDDGRELGPGEWLVTLGGQLRRWDGFVARGEGAAEAARLEAENRFTELETQLPDRRASVEAALALQNKAQTELSQVQAGLAALERALSQAAEEERQALRELDQADAARERMADRRAELDRSAAELDEQKQAAQAELETSEAARTGLPDPKAGRAALEAAQAKHDTARKSMQAATAGLAAHDQALAVARERTAAQTSDIKSWSERAGDAANRLSEMARRFEEIEQERAVIAAKPASLIAEIEQGDAVRERLGAELAKAEAVLARATEAAQTADTALSSVQENLASSREIRAGSIARAENEEERRSEMARISGERFACPPPMLVRKFEFNADEVSDSSDESAGMDKLVADRERIGPVNLVAAD
ncbi:MAG: AAA family ATPase, partial [Sphingomonadaceae bacterium]|nr:AAA family ATPase [Sphingomonadaceae bacterium]